MSRADNEAAYVDQVVDAWRQAFAEAKGDNMPELYGAAQGRAAAGDEERVRRLLLVVRTMLRVHSMLMLNMWLGVQASSPHPEVRARSEKFRTLQSDLHTALTTLADILSDDGPDEAELRAADDAASVQRLHNPGHGDLRGLLAIPVVAGSAVATSTWIGGATVVSLSRDWWRGFRGARGSEGGHEPSE